MKHVVNKNIMHNGKAYLQGSEISESEPGFKDLVQAGHAVPSNGMAQSEAAHSFEAEEAKAIAEHEEVQAKKPGRKGRG